MKTGWRLIAAIAVCLTILTRAKVDVLVFTFGNTSIHFNSESLDQFHNCLCDSRSKTCTVISPLEVTMQSVNHDNLGIPEDDYTSLYKCQTDHKDRLTLICTRAQNTDVCKNHMCHSVCFTNRSSCSLNNVNVIFVFNQITTMKLDAPGTLMHGLCQAEDIPLFPLDSRSKQNLNLSADSNSEDSSESAPMHFGYLTNDDFDCSNVCPAVANIQFSDWVTLVTAFLLYVCGVLAV